MEESRNRLTPRVSGQAELLRALAARCEREEATWDLCVDIELAVCPDAVRTTDEPSCALRRGLMVYNPPDYVFSRDAAARLEPSDAQEVCVRKYRNGGMYVRITLADGRPVYCDKISSTITEPLARCAAALKARAVVAEQEQSSTKRGEANFPTLSKAGA